ncbi:MAG: hypothetical protein R6U95_05270 [Bacteroidales bacterium]
MNKYFVYVLAFLISICASCTKDSVQSEDRSHLYYPLQKGNKYVYKVTYIQIDKPTEINDTVEYMLREQIVAVFIDTLQYETYVVQQDSAVSDSTPWIPVRQIAVRREGNELVRLTNNCEKLVLQFPVSYRMSWDVHVYNGEDEQLATYTDIHTKYESSEFSADSSVTVERANFKSLYSYVYHTQTYAFNVGLCAQTDIDIESQPSQNNGSVDLSLPIEQRVTYGYFKYYNLVSFSGN